MVETRRAANGVMPQATIFAFEPDPRAIAKFRDAITSKKVHLHECAIGAVNGNISFHQSSGAEHLTGYGEGWNQSGSIRRPNTHLKVWPRVKFEKQITVPIWPWTLGANNTTLPKRT
jgi:2-O-methyltransferase